MNAELFKKKFEEASDVVDKEHMRAVELRSIEYDRIELENGGAYKCLVLMEEMGELIQQISKYLRHDVDKSHLIEEFADVTIMIDTVMQVCGVTENELNKAINVKIDALNEKVDKQNAAIVRDIHRGIYDVSNMGPLGELITKLRAVMEVDDVANLIRITHYCDKKWIGKNS